MTDINANMTNSQRYIPLSAADAASFVPGFYTLDSEDIEVTTVHSSYAIVNDNRKLVFDGRVCVRAVGGSSAATHTSGATLTRYYPEAPGGGGVANPLTSDLDAGGFDVTNVGRVRGALGTPIVIEAEDGVGGNGAFLDVEAGSADAGGDTQLAGGVGAAGKPGGYATLASGQGDGGNDPGASIEMSPGDGEGGAGGIALTHATLGFFGTSPVTRPDVPATPTEQDIVDALVALGLVTQAAPE